MPDRADATDQQPERLRLMAVHAHPDDESSKGAATMVRYVCSGADVMVATLTGGERGDILNQAMDRPEVRANLPQIRREEMARAREILGVRQEFLGFVDSGLPEGDPPPPLPDGCFALQKLEDAAEPLVRLVREFRPHVMLTYDENGGYPHPDHVKCHEVTIEAFDAAADPDRYPELGEPWQPLKLYYTQWSRDRILAMHERLLELGLESPFDAKWFDRPSHEDQITTKVEVGAYYPRRKAALLAHATQIDPASPFWFALPDDVAATVHPWDDYQLARSLVDSELPEDDLFAGIRATVRD